MGEMLGGSDCIALKEKPSGLDGVFLQPFLKGRGIVDTLPHPYAKEQKRHCFAVKEEIARLKDKIQDLTKKLEEIRRYL